MAWTTPRTWVAGEVGSAANLNTHVRDNMLAIFSAGPTWVNVTFNSGNFTASGSMTWTVASGDQGVYQWTEIGKTMHVAFEINTSTVGGTPSTELRIAIPNGRTASGTTSGTFAGLDNSTAITGYWRVVNGNAYISLFVNLGTPNWTAATDSTYVRGIATISL
jgi:hypothetical protein